MRAFLSISFLLAFAAVADARPPQATIRVYAVPQSTLAVVVPVAVVPAVAARPVVVVPVPVAGAADCPGGT